MIGRLLSYVVAQIFEQDSFPLPVEGTLLHSYNRPFHQETLLFLQEAGAIESQGLFLQKARLKDGRKIFKSIELFRVTRKGENFARSSGFDFRKESKSDLEPEDVLEFFSG